MTYWQPAEPLTAGNRTDFGYQLGFGSEVVAHSTLAEVVSTRSGLSINRKGVRSFFIDFQLAPFEGRDDPEIVTTAARGTIEHPYLLRLPAEGILRLSFEYVPDGSATADLSAVLRSGESNLTETWLYRWSEG